MNLLEATRQWFRTCPLIDTNNKINLQYLSGDPVSYSLTKTGETTSKDVCGYYHHTYNLALYVRLPWGAELLPNQSAAELFTELDDWVRKQDRDGVYPIVDGETVDRIATANAGMIISADAKTAQYQIQITISTEEE